MADARDKNETYAKVLRLRTVNIAGAAIYDARHKLRTEGVYLSAAVTNRFKEAFDRLSGAQVERLLAFHHGRGGYEKSNRSY